MFGRKKLTREFNELRAEFYEHRSAANGLINMLLEAQEMIIYHRWGGQANEDLKKIGYEFFRVVDGNEYWIKRGEPEKEEK